MGAVACIPEENVKPSIIVGAEEKGFVFNKSIVKGIEGRVRFVKNSLHGIAIGRVHTCPDKRH